jgi:ribosomal protein S6--L-glutamate ligase
MINRILIVTAEPKNFVPLELKKSADSMGLDCQIIDITKTVLIEDLEGSNADNFKLKSACYLVSEEGKLEEIRIDNQTAIIPRLNEYHTEIKLGILKRMEKAGATLLNTAESMELCNDKLMTQVILNSAGIKTPYSVMIQGMDEIEKVVNELEKDEKIKYPFVIKTLRGTHGVGVMKVDGRSSLVSVAQLLNKESIDFMLQEFCKHDKSIRIIMIGQELLASNLRGQPKDKEEFRTNSHLGSETEKYEPSEEELAVGRRIVELFGCNFCAIDYLLTEKKDIIILEVNGSPGLEAIQGDHPDKNLAATVIEHITGKKSEAKPHEAVQTTEPEKAPAEVSSDSEVKVTTEPTANSDKPPEDIPANTIGEVEQCTIHRIIPEVTARIDTGAKYSSLHVDNAEIDGDFVKFKRGDITFKVPLFKTVLIKNVHLGTSVRRPIVKLDITLKDSRLNQVEFTLNDRSTMKYEVLIGRNALSGLGLPVIVSQEKDQVTNDSESEVIIQDEEE